MISLFRFFNLVVIPGGFALAGIFFILFQFVSVDTLRTEFSQPHKQRRSFFQKLFIGTLLFYIGNLLGIVAYDVIRRIGRPTLVYLTNPNSSVALRYVVTGSIVATLTLIAITLLMGNRLRHYQRQSEFRYEFTRLMLYTLLIALLTEIFIFNARHFETAFDIRTGNRFPKVTLERHHMVGRGFYFNRASQRWTSYSPYDQPYKLELYFDQVKVRNIRLNFNTDANITNIKIGINDEAFEFIDNPTDRELILSEPRSLIIPVHTVGETTRIDIEFPDIRQNQLYEFELNTIDFNVTVPFELNETRIALIWLMMMLIGLFRPGATLYRIPLSFADRKQTLFRSALFLVIVALLILTVISNYIGLIPPNKTIPEIFERINKHESSITWAYTAYYELTDALLARQVHLPIRPSNSLLSAERPYDITYRDRYRVEYLWDHVFYQDRYYVYFGIVPVLTTLLPYKAITGENLPLDIVALLFSLILITGFYQMLKRLALREHKHPISLGGFCLSWITLVAISNVAWLLRRSMVYEVAILTGLAFTVWALVFALLFWEHRAATPRNFTLPMAFFAFGAGTCGGLAVGCRPSYVLPLILLPVTATLYRSNFFHFKEHIQTKDFSRTGRWQFAKGFIAFTIPISLIALALMRYNYIRFGAVSEFGFTYQLSFPNESVTTLRTGFTGLFLGIYFYLLHPFTLTTAFPFIQPANFPPLPFVGYVAHESTMAGIFAYPLILLVALTGQLRKRLRQNGTLPFLITALSVCGLFIILNASVGILFRYTSDFSWLAGICAVIVANEAVKNDSSGLIRPIVIILCFGTIAIGICISVTGDNNWLNWANPEFYHRLRYAVSFWL